LDKETVMSEEKKTIQKWGYHPTEEARIFELSEGEDLPEGWAARPVPLEDAPDPAASDEPDSSDDGGEGDTSDLEAENASLKEQVADLEAENASLTAQLEAARAELAESADDEDLNIPHPGAPKEPKLVEIPEDWAEKGAGNHFKRIALAKTINPDMAELIKTDEDAIGIIKAELEKRG
jgi:hypothetical protein